MHPMMNIIEKKAREFKHDHSDKELKRNPSQKEDQKVMMGVGSTYINFKKDYSMADF